MSLLRELAKRHGASKVQPGVREYPDIYEQQFGRRRHAVHRVLEIGVQHGGSLRMWADYFPRATIHGLDCDSSYRAAHAADRIQVHIGRQEDHEFLRRSVIPAGPYDLIVDDGGHGMLEQQTSLLELWPSLAGGGTYVIEDLHTSYLTEPGAKVEGPLTTIEFLKRIVDGLNSGPLTAYLENSGKRRACVPEPAPLAGLQSMQFYGCVCFIHKRPDSQLPAREADADCEWKSVC